MSSISSVGYDEGENVQIGTHLINEDGTLMHLERVSIGVGLAERTENSVFQLNNTTGLVNGAFDIEGSNIVSLFLTTPISETQSEIKGRFVLSDAFGNPIFVTEEASFFNTGLLNDIETDKIFSSVFVENKIGAKYLAFFVTQSPDESADIYICKV